MKIILSESIKSKHVYDKYDETPEKWEESYWFSIWHAVLASHDPYCNKNRASFPHFLRFTDDLQCARRIPFLILKQ